NKPIQQTWIDKRLISLDVDDEGKFSSATYDLRDAIGPALMLGRGQRYFCSPIEGRFRDSHVVRSDDRTIDFVCLRAAFPNTLQERFTRDDMQRFSRKSRRTPPRRDNDDIHLVNFVRMISVASARSSATQSPALSPVFVSKPVRT